MTPHHHIAASFLLAASLACGCSNPGADIATPDKFGQVTDNVLDINGCKLNGCKLNGCKLNGADLNSVQASSAELIGVFANSGVYLHGKDFVGATFKGLMTDGSESTLHVESHSVVTPDQLPDQQAYVVKQLDTGEYLCDVDSNNQPIPAVAMDAVFDPDTGQRISYPGLFTFACRFAALQKCNEYGYPDWASRDEDYGSKASRSLSNYHDACVRMVRADYCGDGTPHTQNGTSIDVYDNLGFNTETTGENGSDGWYYEAEWGPDGAHCINKTRWMPLGIAQTKGNNNSAANPDWAYIQSHCPSRLAVNSPGSCGTHSSYLPQNGYGLPNQSQRSVLRNNTPLYQH